MAQQLAVVRLRVCHMHLLLSNALQQGPSIYSVVSPPSKLWVSVHQENMHAPVFGQADGEEDADAGEIGSTAEAAGEAGIPGIEPARLWGPNGLNRGGVGGRREGKAGTWGELHGGRVYLQ